jgi:hypothetical protein
MNSGVTMTLLTLPQAAERLAVSTRTMQRWIKNRIADYGFTQGIEYIAGNFLPGSDRMDYHCTISMGKELAMVEKSPLRVGFVLSAKKVFF